MFPPFLLVLAGFIFPRIVLFVWWCAGWTTTLFEGKAWPVLGFFFLPLTTLTYMCAMCYNGGQFTPPYTIALVLAVIFDVLRGQLVFDWREKKYRWIYSYSFDELQELPWIPRP